MPKRIYKDVFVQWSEEYKKRHGEPPPIGEVDAFQDALKVGERHYRELERQRKSTEECRTLFRTVSKPGRLHLQSLVLEVLKKGETLKRRHPHSQEAEDIKRLCRQIIQELGLTRERGVRTAKLHPYVGENVINLMQRWNIRQRTAARIVLVMSAAGGYEIVSPGRDEEARGVKAIEDAARCVQNSKESKDRDSKKAKTSRKVA